MNSFPGKVMLFGEYSVIKGSKALAMPYHRFSGELTFAKEQNEGSLSLLSNWLEYLRARTELKLDYDLNAFEQDIAGGISFDCSAPIGYGLGSSGIIVAAFFHKYCRQKDSSDLKLVQQELGIIESFFHGKSSGLDPLISFTDRSLLISKDGVAACSIEHEMLKNVFLLNTTKKRKTSPLVQIFLEKCEKSFFTNKLLPSWIDDVNRCIDKFLTSDPSYREEVRRISTFQHNHFKEMIPDMVLGTWEYGLSSGMYDVKLCGAGGGGFMLVFIHDEKAIARIQNQFELISLYE